MRDLVRQLPLRTCLIYILVGALWILVSDQMVGRFAHDAHQILVLEAWKDFLFIGVSAVLLFWYVHRQLKRQDQTNAELTAVNSELRLQRDLLDSFINSLPGVAYVVDQQKRLLRWNRRFEEVTGRTAAELRAFDPRLLFPVEDAPILEAGMMRALTEGEATVEVNFLDRVGRGTPYLFTGVRAVLDGLPCMVGVGIDITARKQTDALLDGQRRVLEMIAGGAPLPATLDSLLRLIEGQAADLLCSVLLLDPDGVHLRHGVAPSLPESFNEAADGLAIGPRAGSCGTAAFRHRPVLVEDIATDPLWEGGRELAAAHGLRACWSTPILDAQQRVLGTFAVYRRTSGRPNERHLQLIEIATHTAAIAISKQREEEALRESELRHRLMGEIIVSFAFAYRVDPDKKVKLEWATSPIEEIIGYSEAELQGPVSFRSLIHPDDRAQQQAALDRVLAGHSEIMEFRLRTKSGQFRWLQCYNRPEWSEDEQRIVRIYGASQDITERKRAEEAIKQNVSLLTATLESTADGILVVDLFGKITHFNQRFVQLWRLPEKLLAARDDQRALDFVLDQLQNPEAFLAKVTQLYQEPEADSFDVLLFKDGRVFERYSRPQWLDSHPVGRVWSFRDVTARKQAEEALRHSEGRYRLIVETAEEGIWMIDPDNKTSFVNPKMARMLGSTVPEMIGRSMFEFMDDEGRGIANANVERRRQGIREQHEFKFRRQDGSPLWALLATSPIHGQAGQYVGALAMVSDVTERKVGEEALREAGERLHLLSQRLIEIQESERRHLARELHDEIGQALTATKLNLEGVLREQEPAARTKRVADGVTLVERLLRSVRDLSLNLRPPMLDDLGLVPALRWLLDQHARTTGRQVNFNHDLTDERVAAAIETACFRVAQEALTNVTRHSRAHNVHVELRRQTGGLTLSVRDDGKGFNVAKARRRATHGSSLGLVSMEERVALAGGQLTVASSDGGGTELRASFPLKASDSTRNDEIA